MHRLTFKTKVAAVKIIKVIRRHPERWWRQRELGEVTGLSQSGVQRYITSLLHCGILERGDNKSVREGPMSEKYLAAWAITFFEGD